MPVQVLAAIRLAWWDCLSPGCRAIVAGLSSCNSICRHKIVSANLRSLGGGLCLTQCRDYLLVCSAPESYRSVPAGMQLLLNEHFVLDPWLALRLFSHHRGRLNSLVFCLCGKEVELFQSRVPRAGRVSQSAHGSILLLLGSF